MFLDLNKVDNGGSLVHSGLECPGGDLVLLDDVDDRAPTGDAVTVEGVHHGLRDALEQLIRTHLWFPQSLRHSHQLFLASSSSNEVDWFRDTTNEVHVADVGLKCFWVQTCHNGFYKKRSEPPLVQHVRDHVGERLGSHLSCLLQLVHVHPELNLLFDSQDVRCKPGQTNPQMRVHLKH